MNEHFFANLLSMDENPNDHENKDGASFTIKDERVDLTGRSFA